MNLDNEYRKYQFFKFGISVPLGVFVKFNIVKFTDFNGHFGSEAIGGLTVH